MILTSWDIQVEPSCIHSKRLPSGASEGLTYLYHTYLYPRWWFQTCLIFTFIWGNDPIWRAYFSNGLKPPTSYPIPCAKSFFEDIFSLGTKVGYVSFSWKVAIVFFFFFGGGVDGYLEQNGVFSLLGGCPFTSASVYQWSIISPPWWMGCQPGRMRFFVLDETLLKSYIWMFPKMVVPPNHPFLIGFSIINHPFWGTPIFGNIHIWMIIWGQVHFWLRVEMAVKKNLMFVVVVTFLQDPRALNQCYRTWMVTCRCWCMSDVATHTSFLGLVGGGHFAVMVGKKAERQPLWSWRNTFFGTSEARSLDQDGVRNRV